MQGDWLVKRVEMLENMVSGPDGLVAKVDRLQSEVSTFRTEFLQFRDWTRAEFLLVRGEMADGAAALRQEMADGFAAARQDLGAQIEAGDRETRNFMRVLYEDLVSRLTLLQEGLDRRP